jgi:hypothetical protein
MKKPRYTHGFVDRHGRSRYYFRRPGFKQVPLPGLPVVAFVHGRIRSGYEG